MKILQNKVIVGGGCILLAAVFAFGVLPSMTKSRGETQAVIKMKAPVLQGAKITEDMITKTEVGSFGLPENVVKEESEIVGKYVTSSILPEDVILKSRLSDIPADERLAAVMANGQKLVTVSVASIASGVGNHLKSGDVVSVWYYADNEVKTADELKNIEVYSVENNDAVELSEEFEDESDAIAETVTLIVNDAQAKHLILAEYKGKVHLTLEKRGV